MISPRIRRPRLPVTRLAIACLAALLSVASAPAQTAPINPASPPPDGKPHTFAAANGQFLLDGKPFRILSGEMHYPRIPREYWRARLRMARAMGLNAVTTYVFWNQHEPTPGVYDFSGNNDVAEFIREAQQEGLYVILRPGPYVCAEWEFGGYPAWLLKDPTTVVRSSDPRFMQPATRWIKRLGQELAPLQIGNGGPILMVQVENEYGSFGNDHAYMQQNRQALLDAGFTQSQLYTADGPNDIANGSLPDLPIGINFDGDKPNSAQKAFATLKLTRPNGPFFNSEFWAGWFDHWGGPHAHTSTATQAANLDWIVRQGYSVSIYMFCGGTNFGWMNGANASDAKPAMYEPDVTSYDYDAALDESGRPTPKFFAFRDVIAKATGITPPPVPEVAPPIAIPPIQLTESVSLWDTLPAPIASPTPLTMEDIGQAYGYILYRTNVKVSPGSNLVFDALHDYAAIYYGRQPRGTLDRRLGKSTLTLPAPSDNPQNVELNLLVEESSRINYSKQLRTDRKGITHSVALVHPAAQPEISPSEKLGRVSESTSIARRESVAPALDRLTPIANWLIYPIPMQQPESLPFANAPCTGPCFYRGAFTIDHPADTFLDTSQLTKGQLWVNGHALGRFWNIGPQKTLYLPGPWLKPGVNQIVVFDLDSAPSRSIAGLAKPNLGN